MRRRVSKPLGAEKRGDSVAIALIGVDFEVRCMIWFKWFVIVGNGELDVFRVSLML